MVATKLAAVTAKGIEAATSTSEKNSLSSSRPSSLVDNRAKGDIVDSNSWWWSTTTLWKTSYDILPDTLHEAVDVATNQFSALLAYFPSIPYLSPEQSTLQQVHLSQQNTSSSMVESALSMDVSTRTKPLTRGFKWTFQNPYTLIHEPSRDNPSVSVVRSMLSFIPPPEVDSRHFFLDSLEQQQHPIQKDADAVLPEANTDNNRAQSSDRSRVRFSSYASEVGSVGERNASDTQTASRLAEGTIYSLRDLVLEEAIELNLALQFWTERWVKPFLSWLEAGPLGEASSFASFIY